MTILDSRNILSGNDASSLLTGLAMMDKATCLDVFDGEDITIASIDYHNTDESYLAYYQISPTPTIPYSLESLLFSKEHLLFQTDVYQKKPKGFFYGLGLDEEQLNLALDVGFFLICSLHGDPGQRLYLMPSRDFLTPFSKKLGMGKMSDYPSIFRDIMLAQLLGSQDILERYPTLDPQMKLLYRSRGLRSPDGATGGVVYSAFAVKNDGFSWDTETQHTHNTNDTKQIMDLLNSCIGTVDVCRWTMSYKRTNIDMVYPDTHDEPTGITLGVRYSYSDIGEQSYSLQSTLYFADGTMLCCGSAVTTPHKSRLNCETFVSLYQKAFSFAQKCITILQEAKESPESDVIGFTKQLLDKIKFEAVYSQKEFSSAWKSTKLIASGTVFDAYHNVAKLVQYDKDRANKQNALIQNPDIAEQEKEQAGSLVEEHYRRVLNSTQDLFRS